MLDKTTRRRYEAALKRVEKCSGECGSCEKLHVYTADIGPRSFCYALGCDNLPADHFSAISESFKRLRQDAIEALEFELS